jgi:hypothetical protein
LIFKIIFDWEIIKPPLNPPLARVSLRQQKRRETTSRPYLYCSIFCHKAESNAALASSAAASARMKSCIRGDTFDEEGNVREPFNLSAVQSKGGKTRTLYP